MDNGKKFFIGLVFFPIGLVVHGFVLTKLWSWFITSTFTTLPVLTTIQAIGLMFVIDFIFLRIDWAGYAEDTDFNTWVTKFISHTAVTPFFLLGIAWIINLFM
jgi:hypothetical protein